MEFVFDNKTYDTDKDLVKVHSKVEKEYVNSRGPVEICSPQRYLKHVKIQTLYQEKDTEKFLLVKSIWTYGNSYGPLSKPLTEVLFFKVDKNFSEEFQKS